MRRLIFILISLIVLIIIIVLFNALTFSIKNSDYEQAGMAEFDSIRIAQNLSRAIKYKTISYTDTTLINNDEFTGFQNFLQGTFPATHSVLENMIINQHSLVYKWIGTNQDLKPVLLMAHMDVVPVDSATLNQWTYDPFSGEIAQGYIWGRGTLDDKLNVMGILEAIEYLINKDFNPERTMYFAFGHDEEIGGPYGAAAIADYFEKEGVYFEYVMDEGSLIVKGVIPGVLQPVAMIGLAEKGYLTLKLTTNASGGHSSMPPRNTAIGRLSKAITKLEANPLPANMEFIDAFFENVGPYLPFMQKVIFANKWLFSPLLESMFSQMPEMNAEIRTTTAVTVITGGFQENVLPSQASALVNFRIIPGETMESVSDYVKNIIDDSLVRVLKHGSGQNPSDVSTAGSEGYNTIVKSIKQVSGDQDIIVTPFLVIAATDGRYFSGISDNVYRYMHVIFGPQDIKRIHGINERIAIKEYTSNVRFLTQLIKNANMN